jgi:phosphatidylserine decarboxylase
MEEFTWPEKPNQTAFPVARPGYPYIFAAAFATAVFALLGLVVPALIGLVAAFCIIGFFRDPDRVVPTLENAVVSPADGKVIRVRETAASPFAEGPVREVSIFMSVLNVHVNRIAHEGTVRGLKYFPGRFFTADKDIASDKNERNAVLVETDSGHNICFVQVAGKVARRIVCGLQEGDVVRRGQRFGMICFGSRLDVFLPPDADIAVRVGDRVQAGTSVLGYLK